MDTFIEFFSSHIALTMDRSMMDIVYGSAVRAGFFSAVASVLLLIGVALVVRPFSSKRIAIHAAGVVMICYGAFMFFRPLLAIDMALLVGFVGTIIVLCAGIFRLLKLSTQSGGRG